MIPRILCALALTFATVSAADPTPEDLLRQGLFEEEANRDFDKAAERYRAVITAHDRQRSLASTATFRLGEIARKKNDTDAAAAAFRTVIERFPEQEDLARLSRENLAALGMTPAATPPTPSAPLPNDPEDAEIARLKEITRNSPDLLDGADATGWRPLHHAAKNGWTKVISYLLENRADPNSRTLKEQLTPLHLAAIHGHLGAIKALLAAKADIDSAVRIILARATLPVMDRKADKADGEWTALDLAVLYNRREIARALIAAGADLKRTGPEIGVYLQYPFTSLLLAIYLQRDDLVMDLVQAGAPLGFTSDRSSLTLPLIVAVHENPRIVAPLLKAGADPKLARENGFTALHAAISNSKLDTTLLLIEAGADVTAASSSGNTPLHAVSMPEMVELLVTKGADPNAKNKEGLTPLDIIVAARGDTAPAIFDALLKHGAKVEDAKALLKRTCDEMLPLVREKVVYPKEQRPDAILLSLSGNYSLTIDAPPVDSVSGRRRPAARPLGFRPETPPILIPLEIRPTKDSPPPSLAEGLCEVLEDRNHVESIKILRRDATGRFETILDWPPSESSPMPEGWPALQWGDIVEFRTQNHQSATSIATLRGRIPARTITVRIGEFSFPKRISGIDRYWLDRSSIFPIPNIGDIADLTRFVIHRKGATKPIAPDFKKTPETRIRLLDGDIVEMSWNLKALHQKFGEDNSRNVVYLFGKQSSDRYSSGISLAGVLAQRPVTPSVDSSHILILRRAQNWKAEILDYQAWLNALPPRDQWEKAAPPEAPELNPGDVLVLVEDQNADAEKTANEVREMSRQLEFRKMRTPIPAQIPAQIPRSVPPPSPQR